MFLSFKDWIASLHKTTNRLKRLQEDIVSDDNFPDTFDFEEMEKYLRSNNVSTHMYSLFVALYKEYKNRMQFRYNTYCRRYGNQGKGV